MRTAIPVVMMLAVASMAWAQTDPPLIVRHAHYFVIVNDADGLPSIKVQSRAYYTYPDDLEVQVIDDQSRVIAERIVAMGGSMELTVPGPPVPLYLAMASPGMNGVIFDCDRPWGIVAAGSYGLGSSGKAPPLHLYVPPECEQLAIKAQATSPREGIRLVVTDSTGAEVLVIDGEADALVQEDVTVAPAERGKVWTLTLSDPQSCDARLDDIQLWVEGYVAPLLWPDAQWAATHGPMVWQRHKAVLDGQ